MIKDSSIKKILEACAAAGGDFAEIFAEDRLNTQISLMDKKIDTGLTAREFGIGIRVFSGNRYAYTYTTDFSEDNLLKIVKGICSSMKKSVSGFCFPTCSPENCSASVDMSFDTVGYGKKTNLVRHVEAAGLSFDSLIKKMQVKYVDQVQNVLIANTDGLYKEDTRYKTRLLITAYAEKNGTIQSGYVGPGASAGFEYYDRIDADSFGREAARAAVAMVDAEYCPAGQMSVVVDNGFGGLLFHEACGHSLEASGISKGNSEFTNMIDKKIASDLVTLIDDGSIPGQWGSCNIDDEGTKTRKNILIEKGILKTYLTDIFNGRIIGSPTNGSGRRESYKYAPTSRMSNTYIASGDSTKEEIIANTEYGLFVAGINGGSVNPITGEFNFSVAESYLIKNGKIDIPVKGATLIGTGGSVLKNVDMVADNLSIGQGFCYAGSGALYIGAGQPTVRVSEMTVGGIEK